MRRAMKGFVAMATAALIWAPAQARADGYVSPWVAANSGAGFESGNVFDNGRAGFGVSAGAMGGGIFGAEVDFGYSPSFFGTSSDFGNNSVINVMGNLIVGIPIGGDSGRGVRPFVTAGLGLIRTQVDGGILFPVSSSNNDFGWNAGVGVMGFFNDHVGLRGDLRYLRTLENNSTSTNVDFDPGGFHFWRASAGVVIR
jgi:hypothetical protein